MAEDIVQHEDIFTYPADFSSIFDVHGSFTNAVAGFVVRLKGHESPPSGVSGRCGRVCLSKDEFANGGMNAISAN